MFEMKVMPVVYERIFHLEHLPVRLDAPEKWQTYGRAVVCVYYKDWDFMVLFLLFV